MRGLPVRSSQVHPAGRFYLLFLAGLLSLACGVGNLPALPGLPTRAPTPSPTQPVVGINFEVTVVSPLTTATPTLTPTPTALPTPPPTPTPPEPTLAVTPTLEVPASPLPGVAVEQAATLTPTLPITSAAAPPPPAGPAAPPPVAAPPVSPAIVLLAPPNNETLSAKMNSLDFKWQFFGSFPCRLPDGFGFELRLWPAVTGYGPLGVMDAVKDQKKVGCDPERGIYNILVEDLRGTPGVQVVGQGKFLWDVAYIKLDPYSIVATSEQRLFEMPPKSP